MNEKNIIQYLQANKRLGVAFAFMPKEVQEWARKNSMKLCCYTRQPIESTYKWMLDGSYKQIYQDELYALPDDFEPEGCWVEYDIKEGRFYEETHGIFYAWHEWSKCMSDNPRFTGFGGWLFDGDDGWYTTPCIKECNNGSLWNYINGEAKPVIPIKIRFWKG